MTTYKIDFEYLVPEFSSVELDATDEADARALAIAEIEKLYPEATEIELVKVSTL